MAEIEIEIPEYFVCPISLQIMKDPVTAITGISYDRESIEKWLNTTNHTCPVTKQQLPPGSGLTPNHTLRRLIQAWCTLNTKYGVYRIPTPKSPLGRSHVLKLIRNLDDPNLSEAALKKMELLAGESEQNRKCMEEAGAIEAVVTFLVRRYRDGRTIGVSEALSVLRQIPAVLSSRNRNFEELIGCLKWIISSNNIDDQTAMKTNALRVLKMILEVSEMRILERLETEFFGAILNIIKETGASKQVIKVALEVLLEACTWGRNRTKMLEANAIFELIELELEHPSDKHITELVFDLMAQLCVFAHGRTQFLGHAGAVALTAKRILRVSPAMDERAVHILSAIARFSATKELVTEMLRVGAVAKLCMVMQADCGGQLKEEARRILRMHSNFWNNSPCIDVYLLTRDAR